MNRNFTSGRSRSTPRCVQRVDATPCHQAVGRKARWGMAVGRRGITARERADMWERWKAGESLSAISRVLGKPPGSVLGFLRSNGGIAPPVRKRSGRCLTLADREEISRGLSSEDSLRDIAGRLGRSPSTVSREVSRNGGVHRYRATAADAQAWDQARRPKPCKLAACPRLRRVVARKLQADWSPEQIAGWLR